MTWNLHFIKIPKGFPNAFKFSNHSPNGWFPTWSLAAGWKHVMKLVKSTCLGWRPSHWSPIPGGWSLGIGIWPQDGHPLVKVILYLFLSWLNHSSMVWRSRACSLSMALGTAGAPPRRTYYPRPTKTQNTQVTGLTKQFLFKRPAAKAGAHSTLLTTENQTRFNPSSAISFPQSSTSSSTSNPLGPSYSSINVAKRTRASEQY